MSSFDIKMLLRYAVQVGASDVHLKIDNPPLIRNVGLMEQTEFLPIDMDDMKKVLNDILPGFAKAKINEILDLDFSVEIQDIARFRVNLCRELGNISLVFRVIPYEIPAVRDLMLPPVIENFTKFKNGIVLVTGQTGSGKSTTIASLLDKINSTSQKHIITLEDPIEFLHSNKKSIFTQRQVGSDVANFPEGVKYALRQDPDIIVIGEMRDRETITNALKAAETGHLVFSTLHTNDAIQTINRILSVFEPHERETIRGQIANTLRGTVSQKLIRNKDKTKRIPAAEILFVTPAAKNYIEKNEIEGVYELMKNGKNNGMMTMNNSLCDLVKAGLIEEKDAISNSDTPTELQQLLRGAYHGTNQ